MSCGLKTPKSGKKNSNVIYSKNGSGAILSNRRGRFWNNNVGTARSCKSGRKLKRGFSSSKKYKKDFVSKMENF